MGCGCRMWHLSGAWTWSPRGPFSTVYARLYSLARCALSKRDCTLYVLQGAFGVHTVHSRFNGPSPDLPALRYSVLRRDAMLCATRSLAPALGKITVVKGGGAEPGAGITTNRTVLLLVVSRPPDYCHEP